MVGQAIDIVSVAFGQCLVWFQSLIDAVDGKYYIVAAFVMVAVAALIVYPIRGSGFTSVGFSEFTKGAASFRPARHGNGRFTGSNVGYRGKFEKLKNVRGNRAGK